MNRGEWRVSVAIPCNHVHLLDTDQFDNHRKNVNTSFAALFGEENMTVYLKD